MNALRKSSRGGNLEAQRERAIETRAAIITVARALFAEIGFHAAGTVEIAARAHLTRGALYHHFADKEELFAAVFCQVAEELNSDRNRLLRRFRGVCGER
jgi:AcrR family transcriptional regulator